MSDPTLSTALAVSLSVRAALDSPWHADYLIELSRHIVGFAPSLDRRTCECIIATAACVAEDHPVLAPKMQVIVDACWERSELIWPGHAGERPVFPRPVVGPQKKVLS